MSDVLTWVSRLPTLQLFLVLMAAGLVVSLGLTVIADRAFDAGSRTRTSTSTSVTTVIGVIAGLDAVLIAFVIVNEWQAFNDAQEQVSNESAALSATSFNANVLPEPGRSEILRSIRAYDRSVVCDEIPHLVDHEGPATKTRVALQELFATVARSRATPTSETAVFYAATVTQLGDVAQARRSRINAALSPLPDLLLIVSLNLALVLTLDRPFDGAARVSDAPLREGLPAKGLRCT